MAPQSQIVTNNNKGVRAIRCFSCNIGLGAKPFLDPPTGRYYCEPCREIIWDAIGNIYRNDDGESVYAPVDEILEDDTLGDFNFPAENYDE